MPRPRSPSDAEKIEEVYIDESSQTGHRHFFIGGIVIPQRLSEQFKQDILKARGSRLAAERAGTDELYEMGWSEVGRRGFKAYKPVLDVCFDYADKHAVEFQCSVVLAEVSGRKFSGGRGKTALNNEYCQHCFQVAIYHKTNLFEIHPDRRHSDDGESAKYDSSLRKRLRALLMRTRDTRDNPVRKVESLHSHKVQALQVADLLIGALAFRLNRHSDADNANPDKLLLCEYILGRGGMSNYIDGERGTFLPKTTGRFQIWPQRIAEAKKNPPIRKKVTAVKKEISLSSPVTLGDLVREDKLLWVYCCSCGRERDVNPATVPLPPETPVPDVGKHMRCSACGSKKINTNPELYPGGTKGIR